MLPKIIYTIGPPRSGKTSFCEWLLRNPTKLDFDGQLGLVMLDEDALRFAVNGRRFNDNNEELTRTTKHIVIRALIHQGYAVIVSDTHTRWESIRPLLEIDPFALGIILEHSIVDCVARAIANGREELVPVIERTYTNFVYLTLHRYDIRTKTARRISPYAYELL